VCLRMRYSFDVAVVAACLHTSSVYVHNKVYKA